MLTSRLHGDPQQATGRFELLEHRDHEAAIVSFHSRPTTSDSRIMSNAVRMKEEGNKLFLAKKYEEAVAKYSEAIEEDDSNAVLYANRAACTLNLLRLVECSTS